LVTNLFGENLLVLVLFLLSGKFDLIRLDESAVSQEINGVFEADVSRVLG
jgi:hypothetical protein